MDASVNERSDCVQGLPTQSPWIQFPSAATGKHGGTVSKVATLQRVSISHLEHSLAGNSVGHLVTLLRPSLSEAARPRELPSPQLPFLPRSCLKTWLPAQQEAAEQQQAGVGNFSWTRVAKGRGGASAETLPCARAHHPSLGHHRSESCWWASQRSAARAALIIQQQVTKTNLPWQKLLGAGCASHR